MKWNYSLPIEIFSNLLNIWVKIFNIGGMLVGCLIVSSLAEKAAKHYVFGHNGNGGDMLAMYTSIN